jgi:tetratricopeptide (TPR) repeat protein
MAAAPSRSQRSSRKPDELGDEAGGEGGGNGDERGEPPSSRKLPRNRSMLLLGAVALIALAVLTSPRDQSLQAKLEQGVAAYNEGRPDRARELYNEVLSQDPDNAVANFNLGVAAHHEKRLPEAETYYRKALETDPDFVVALFNYAILKENQGDYETAERNYRRILEKNPDEIGARVNLGFLLVEKLNRREEGIQELGKALELDPRVVSRIPPDLRPGTQAPSPPAP